VAVALATAGARWHPALAAAAVLGFAGIVGAWWLYFDRQADVALTGSTTSVVIYSYAHIPLLIGLAGMSAGVRLLIEHASDPHLGLGATAALAGGVILYLLSLMATRSVTIPGAERRGQDDDDPAPDGIDPSERRLGPHLRARLPATGGRGQAPPRLHSRRAPAVRRPTRQRDRRVHGRVAGRR